MRATPSRPGATAALLAAAVAILWSPTARAVDTLWPTDVNATSGGIAHRLKGLATPGAGADALRLQDLAVGACVIQSSASGYPATFSCLGTPDPIALVAGNLTLKIDSTLHIVGGQLSVVSAGPGTGAATSVLGVAGGSSATRADIACTGDGQVLWDNAGTVVCAALPYAKLSGSPAAITQITGDLLAGPGSGSVAGTIAANVVTLPKLQTVTGLSVLGVPAASTANVSAITASANGQVFQMLGGSLQFHSLDYSQLTGTPAAVTSVTGAVTGSGPGATATTFGLAGAHSVLAVGGGSSAVPAFIGPATAAEVFMADPSTAALGWEIPPLVTLSTPGYMSAGDKLKINGGVTPTLTTDLLRYGGLQGCVGVLDWTGSALGCAPTLGFSDPFAVVGGNLTLQHDATLGVIAGQLSVLGAAPTGSASGSLGGSYPGPTVLLAPGAVGYGNGSGVMTGDATNFHWDAADTRLGLREATPAFQLHIVDETGASDRGLMIGSHFASATGTYIRLGKSRGSYASPAAVAAGDYLDRIDWQPYNGSAYISTAGIGARALSAPSSGNVQSQMFLALNRAGLSNDPFTNNEVGLYLTTLSSGAPPLVTIPSLGLTGNNGVVFANSTSGELLDSPLLTFNSNTLTIGPNGPGPTAGNAPLYINGGGSALPAAIIINAAVNSSGSIGFYSPFNGSGTGGIIDWVGPGSPEATTYGLSNALVFDNKIGSITAFPDAAPVVFRSITAVGGTYFNGFTVDPYASTTWANSSAPISVTGSARVRSASGHLQYSENGGAWTNFDAATVGGITALFGDGTAGGPGSVPFTLHNIPTAVTKAGYVNATGISAPATPATGHGNEYYDSSAQNFGVITEAGAFKHGVQTLAAVAHTYLTGINDAGFPSSALVAEADVTSLSADLSTINTSLAAKVPTARTLTMTAPMTCDGSSSCDLSANRTIATPLFTSGSAGLAPASGGGTLNFLRADGTYAVPPGGGTFTPTGTGLGGVTSGAWDAAATTVSTGLHRTTGVLTADLSVGISGGQAVIGGTGSGDSLTLSSTSNATKGQVKSDSVIVVPVGSLGAPSFTFSGNTSVGLWDDTANSRVVLSNAAASTGSYYFNGAGIAIGSNSARVDFSFAGDVAVARDGLGFLLFTDTNGAAFRNSALSTSATAGFLELPSTAGVPTGTVSTIETGQLPIVFDSSDDRLYVDRSGWKIYGQYTGGLATGPLCNTTGTGALSACTSSSLATTLGMPTAGQIDISGGTGSAPVGDSNFTYNTSTHVMTSSGGSVLGGSVVFSGAAGAGENLLAVGNTGAYELGFPGAGLSFAGGVLNGVPFVASGGSHSIGMVTDPGGTAGTTRVLYEDTLWKDPGFDVMHFYNGDYNGLTTTTWMVPGTPVLAQQSASDPPETREPFQVAHVRLMVHNLGTPSISGCNTTFAVSQNGSPIVASELPVTTATSNNTFQDTGRVSVSTSSTDSFGVILSSAPSNGSVCNFFVYVTAYLYAD